MDAVQFPAGDRQVSRVGGAAGQQDCVVVAAQVARVYINADVATGTEHHTFLCHLFDTPVQDPLLHLEFRDTVTQQAADAVVPLKYRHVMARTGQLLGGGQPRRPGPDHGHPLAGLYRSRLRLDPAVLPGLVDDREFHRLDGHRIIVDSEHAGPFTGRRTQGAGKFREIVGCMQPVNRFQPLVPVNQVIPVRDQVSQGAPLVTERNTAIHAA